MGSRRLWIPLSWLAALLGGVFLGFAILDKPRGASEVTPQGNLPASKAYGGKIPAFTETPGLERYAQLSTGKIFFGLEPPQVMVFPQTYVSSFTLRAIIRDGSGKLKALLAVANSTPTSQTWLVGVGQTVQGETVKAIRENGITLVKGGMEAMLVLSK